MTRVSRLSISACGSALAVSAVSSAARAQVTVYDNFTNDSGLTVLNGNAANVGASKVTSFVANRIVTASGSGGAEISLIGFSVVSNDNANFTFPRIRIGIWDSLGINGGPGNLISSLLYGGPISGNSRTLRLGLVFPGIKIPENRTIWMGMAFQSDVNNLMSLSQLNNFGQAVYGAPSVGSSDDSYFVSSVPSLAPVSNPVGTILSSPFGGAPPATLAWRVDVVSLSAPEPGTFALVLVGALGLFVVRRTQRTGVRQKGLGL